MEIKKAEKITDEDTEVTGLEVKFEDDRGNTRTAAFDDYDDACQNCENCGKPRWKCSLEKDKKVKPPQEREHGSGSRANGKSRKRTNVEEELGIK